MTESATESATTRYAMGYDDRERRRLQLQASIINPVTEQLLRRAGLVTQSIGTVHCGDNNLPLVPNLGNLFPF
jgi:hypothetical protein